MAVTHEGEEGRRRVGSERGGLKVENNEQWEDFETGTSLHFHQFGNCRIGKYRKQSFPLEM